MNSHIAMLALLVAHAASADSSAAKAEALFRQGRDLMASGKLGEACAAFDASQKLAPATTTLFNQADCREKAGQIATAWGLFVEAERQTRGATDDAGGKLHKVALDRSAKLEARVSKLTVKVAHPVAGLVILRGDDTVDQGEWNHPLPIDGGTYTFTAKVADKPVWSETVTVAKEAGDTSVDVIVKDVPAVEPAAGATPAVQPPATVAIRRDRTRPVLATAGAVVLLGGALVFEMWGDSTYDRAKAAHDINLWHSANTKRYIAEGLLVGGIGCTALAVWLWLRHEPATETQRTVLVPTASAGTAGLALQGGW